MYNRAITPELLSLSQHYPVVTLMGPRQSGKTTLVKNAFPSKSYVNLEALDDRLLAQTDPRTFLERYPDGAIFDEIQRVPELLSYIQVIVDEKKQKGMYILTGSHQLKLHEAIGQSLAGRTGLLNLYPLTIEELKQTDKVFGLDEQIIYGFYPGVYRDHLNPTKAYSNYVQTYIEKDIRQISEIKNLIQFQTFMKLCAGRIGQVLDYSSLANDVGVSSNTIKHWLSVLEASYIIFRLTPYFENFGKRLIKSPKLYFCDTGLACFLLDIEHAKQVSRDPLRGNLVENLVVLELIKHRYNQGLEPNIYFYRDNHKREVDIIIKQGHELIPVEIKAAKTFNSSFLKSIRYIRNLAPERITKGYVIYSGEQEQLIDDIQLLNYRHTDEIYSSTEIE